MRSGALLILVGLLATGAFARRAVAGWREPARPLPCNSVVGLIAAGGESLACQDDRRLQSCGPLRGGRRYAGCVDAGPLRGALLRLSGQAIDVSVATAEDLSGLPGIGPGLASRILQTRSAHRLCALEDLRQVSGIGPHRLEALAGRVIFGDPLCAAPASK